MGGNISNDISTETALHSRFTPKNMHTPREGLYKDLFWAFNVWQSIED